MFLLLSFGTFCAVDPSEGFLLVEVLPFAVLRLVYFLLFTGVALTVSRFLVELTGFAIWARLDNFLF